MLQWWVEFNNELSLLFINRFRGTKAGKAPKAWALSKFWVSTCSYKKQPIKKILGRILGLALLKFVMAPLQIQCYLKVRRMGITEILREIWLFSSNNIKSSELRHIIVTIYLTKLKVNKMVNKRDFLKIINLYLTRKRNIISPKLLLLRTFPTKGALIVKHWSRSGYQNFLS